MLFLLPIGVVSAGFISGWMYSSFHQSNEKKDTKNE